MSSVLFCPFCRESFENVTRCPEHDVVLVTWDELPTELEHTPESDDLPFWDLRYGRGGLYGGALSVLVGFCLPVVTTSLDPRPISGAMLALTRAPNLWIVPATAFAALSVVARRRLPASLRGARAALLGLCAIAALSIALTTQRVMTGVAHVEARLGRTVDVTPELGAYVLCAGLLLWLVSAFRLGVVAEDSP